MAINRGDGDDRAGYEDLPENEIRADQLDRCIAERESEIASQYGDYGEPDIVTDR